MTIVLVEGDSDRLALETLARRLGIGLPEMRVLGGAKSARRIADTLAGSRLIGLVDANERADFDGVTDPTFVCEPDLEGELVRALGTDAVIALIEAQGEEPSWRRLRRQPAQRSRSIEQQLARFLGGRSGNKARYAGLMAEAVPLTRIPAPLEALLRAL